MVEKELAKINLSKLIDKFERELSSEKIKDYNEEATKISFIQPFLRTVLGWNVQNIDEVSPEENISRGRVDYGLKIDGKPQIFIEVKAPKIDLEKHIDQVIKYGYNRRGVPIVVLTNFHSLQVFDVTIKPDSKSKLRGLKLNLTWDRYLDRFEELWLLSKKSVLDRSFEKLLVKRPEKDRITVDKAFLIDLREWRERLSKNIFKNNHDLFQTNDRDRDAQYLREISQKIIDRIIFMRSCEDRELVIIQKLEQFFMDRTDTSGLDSMIFLRHYFKQYDLIFNSDLFVIEDWEDKVRIDFRLLKDIILSTYYPYQFDVIPVEILGNIYEQYLAHTVRLTDLRVKYEIRPEVRKSGGVYYTPEYIVDFMVKQTVGTLFKELSPKGDKAVSVLDPACGSGSFLIAAYRELLRHCNVKTALTIEEKRRMLRDSIYGVDIDDQAVEITKLSLMLQMLEDESGAISGRSILPMLDKNIRCGNSLLNGNSLKLKEYFGDDWYKSNPFYWRGEFKKVFTNQGGFDVIIGNPPYIQLSMEKDTSDNLKKFLVEEYGSSMGRLNTFGFFIKLGITLLKEGGYLSYIVPNTILTQDYYEELREIVLNHCSIRGIVSFEDLPFRDAVVENVIIILKRTNLESKRLKNHVTIYNVNDKLEFIKAKDIEQRVFTKTYKKRFNIYLDDELLSLKEKIEVSTEKLNFYLDVNQAIALKHDREKNLSINKINENYKPVLDGRDIKRYYLNWGNMYLNYDVNMIHSCKREDIFFSDEKLLFRRTGNRLIATYDDNQFYALNTLVVMNRKAKIQCNLKFLLALFNSSLLDFYYKAFLKSTKKVFSEIQARQVEQLPVRIIDLTNDRQKQQHDDLVSLVNILLELNKRFIGATKYEQRKLNAQMRKIDGEIDDLVFSLYDISSSDRKSIEEWMN